MLRTALVLFSDLYLYESNCTFIAAFSCHKSFFKPFKC